MKPRVLVVSRSAWDDTNNSGNTLSNLFQRWDIENIANLYCRDGIPNNKICNKYFKISESLIIKKILGKTKVAGLRFFKEVDQYESRTEDLKSQEFENSIYNFFRNNRWQIFLWARELIWKTNNWKSEELKNFLLDFKPDIIYSPAYDSFYMYDLVKYSNEISKAKIVFFHCDDYASYRQYSFSPLFWINRILLRFKIKQSVYIATKNYCIVEEQCNVYKDIFNVDFKSLSKTGTFDKPFFKEVSCPVKIVYAGNIVYGRLKTLLKIVSALDKINQSGAKAVLNIYTGNVIPKKILKKLQLSNSVNFMGKISYTEIPEILTDADILLHVESFDKKEMLATSLSFSTKLVDYFIAGRCILAIGWVKSASIKYLKSKDSAILVNDLSDIEMVLWGLVNSNDKILEYSKRAWNCGNIFHNKDKVLDDFENDLRKISTMSGSNNN